MIKHSLFIALFALSQTALAAVSFSTPIRMQQLPQGVSIGFPETAETELAQEFFRRGLQTGLGFENEDLKSWTDDQIENRFQDEIDLTYELMERAALDPVDAIISGGQIEAARGSGGMSSLTCMAIAIQGEAGGESAAGKAAVAETIMSRAKGEASRVCSVVFARAQFEAMSKKAKKPSAETMRIAQDALKRGNKCGFDHFINKKLQLSLGRKIPTWVHEFERRGCRTQKIGLHTFYSSCNCKR